MKSSRYAEEVEHSVYADLRSSVETSQASKKEMLTSIGEDIRAVSRNTEFLRFLLAMTHRNPIRQDLIYNESAALTNAHVKRCKLRKEADIVATQSSTDWSTRSTTGATSLVKEHDQYNSSWKYSTTEGTESVEFKAEGKMVEISPQQIISCDTADDDCIEGDLITVFNHVMDAESIDCDVDYPESSNGGCGGSGLLLKCRSSEMRRTRGVDEVFISIRLQV